jgi:asparagine synthase (glutamine-hydrolysing)
MLYRDGLQCLPDDMLTKVDRASMGVNLEVRVPLLDHRVVEFAAGLPEDYLIREKTGKALLRHVLHRHVPQPLFERPKQGFRIPIGEWLRGPLLDWCENLLDERKLRQDGFLQTDQVRTMWREHRENKRDWNSQLWAVLMFQSWLETTKQR